MSGFKKLKKSDVIVTPYVANKHWGFFYDTYTNHNDGITILKGTRVTGAFDHNNDPITEGQYERLVYNSINNLFYPTAYTESYSGSSIPDFYTGSLRHNQTSPFYYKYIDNPNFVQNFPTGSNAGIRVLNISKNIYSQAVHPGTFLLSSSAYMITDDTNGNLYDTLPTSSDVFVGNIFYEQGLAVITDQGYQNIFPLPPIAGTAQGFWTGSISPKTINVAARATARTGILNTASIQLISGRTDLYTVNGDGTVTLNTNIPGSYPVTYTINETFGTTILTSNIGNIYGTVGQEVISITSFYSNPIIMDENSIVGNKATNTWLYPAKTSIFPVYFTATTSSLYFRVALFDSLGIQDRYNGVPKLISQSTFNYLQLDFTTVNYRYFDTYYIEFLDKDNNWRTITSGTPPSAMNSAGFFGTIRSVNVPPVLSASMDIPFLTSTISAATGSSAWYVSEFNSGSFLYSTASGQFTSASAATASFGTISLNGTGVTASVLTGYGGFTASYAVDYYYENDFHLINTTSSLNFDFGNILSTIYGAGNTHLGYRYYSYVPVIPDIPSSSFAWIEDTFTCAQDGIFIVGTAFPGFSSPIGLMYDSASALMYVVDGDATLGNFFSLNPATFVNTSSLVFYSGSQDRIYASANDYTYRRMYAVGRNSGGLKSLDLATHVITTVSGGFDDSAHGVGHNGFNRLSVQVLSSKIIMYDVYSTVLTTIDRPSLTVLTNQSQSAIVGGTTYIGASSFFTEIGSNIWVTPAQVSSSAIGDVAIYNSSMTSIVNTVDLTTVGLPYHSKFWDNNVFWRSVYFDSANSAYYVYDYGSNYFVVINTNTQTVIASTLLFNFQGKTNAAVGFVVDPITGDIFLSGRHQNNSNDGIFTQITYKIDKSTFNLNLVLPATQFGKLENVIGTNILWGNDPGIFIWNSPNTGYGTDGVLTTYTR